MATFGTGRTPSSGSQGEKASISFWLSEQPSGIGHMRKRSRHGLSHLKPVLCTPSVPMRGKRLTFRSIYTTQCDFRGLSIILKCQAAIFNKNIIFDLKSKYLVDSIPVSHLYFSKIIKSLSMKNWGPTIW